MMMGRKKDPESGLIGEVRDVVGDVTRRVFRVLSQQFEPRDAGPT
jgi:hypothetical protein